MLMGNAFHPLLPKKDMKRQNNMPQIAYTFQISQSWLIHIPIILRGTLTMETTKDSGGKRRALGNKNNKDMLCLYLVKQQGSLGTKAS